MKKIEDIDVDDKTFKLLEKESRKRLLSLKQTTSMILKGFFMTPKLEPKSFKTPKDIETLIELEKGLYLEDEEDDISG